MKLPAALDETWDDEPEWLARLPALAADCAAEWGLVLEDPIDTPHSLVVPGGDVVLKLNAPTHYEADHEADALAHLDGRGAVRLVERDDRRRAFLIERCRPGTPLWDTDEDAPAVVADILPSFWVELEDGHPFRLLADEAARWALDVPARYDIGGRPFERSLVDLAVDVFRDVDHGARWLVNQDLHGGNLLRAEREPWLMIDPKPLAGERELDGVGLLRNAADGGTTLVRRWLDVLTDLGLDRDRVQRWGVAHALAWGWDEDGWSDRSVEAARTIAAA